ncbi:hypothetical protein NKH19_13995 [Mesorhizobium sp. M1338]|uniref:hypothetical protein n=1 Tax=unclassified Mesorhizobium TaxID=325217 RepID=UPI00333D66ED
MRTPSMAGILGYFFGASGEIVVDMQTSGGKNRKGRPVCPIRRAGARALSSLCRTGQLGIKLAFQICWRRRELWRYEVIEGNDLGKRELERSIGEFSPFMPIGISSLTREGSYATCSTMVLIAPVTRRTGGFLRWGLR